MAGGYKVRPLMFFLLYTIIVNAICEHGKETEDDQVENLPFDKLYEPNILLKLLDNDGPNIMTNILRENIKEILKENVLKEFTTQIQNLKEAANKQNTILEQLNRKMAEKDKLIDDLVNRVHNLEDLVEGKSDAVQGDQPNDAQTIGREKNEPKNTIRNRWENTTYDILIENKDQKGHNKEDLKDKKLNQITKRQQTSSEKVAFSVYLSFDLAKETDLNNVVIKYDSIILNQGNMYNKYTGIFTAPIQGIYFFSFHCLAAFDGLLNPTVMKNGQPVLSSYLDPQKFGVESGNSVLIHLDKGDSVWVEIFSNRHSGVELTGLTSHPTTSFSGFLLN